MGMKLVTGLVLAAFLVAACSATPDGDSSNRSPVVTESEGGVDLTFGRIIEEIRPEPGTTVTFEIQRSGETIFVNTYDVTFGGSDHQAALATVALPPVQLGVRAQIQPVGTECETTVDLSNGVPMSVNALIRSTCFLEVEETEGWLDNSGAVLTNEEIEEFYGGGHCGWEDVRFIALGEYFVGDAYIRDERGVFDTGWFATAAARERLGLTKEDRANPANLEADEVLRLDLDAELPPDVVPLGYQRGVRELFVSPDGDYLFVISPQVIEQWPRVTPHPGCA